MPNAEKLKDIELTIGNPKSNLKLFKFNSSNFSTKVGNNFVPKKYSDLELYSLNLLSDKELIDRKTEEYEKLLKENKISEEDFIERTTHPIEVAREFSNVKRYYEYDNKTKESYTGKDYFTGEVIKYSIDKIKIAAEKSRRSANTNNNYNGVVVIITDKDTDSYHNNLETILDYFMADEEKYDPSNFFTATEGRATFDFFIQREFPKNSSFSDNEFVYAFNSSGNNDYLSTNNYINRNHIISFTIIKNKFIILKCSSKFKQYFTEKFYVDNFFRYGIQKLILNRLDYDIDYLIFTTYPKSNLPFIFSTINTTNQNFKGAITLSEYKNIYNGPMLHEIIHYFCNNIVEGQSCVVKAYQEKINFNDNFYTYLSYGKEYPLSSNNGPHWGFTNTPGQLGGFDESIIEEITNNTNYPIDKKDIGTENDTEVEDTVIDDNATINKIISKDFDDYEDEEKEIAEDVKEEKYNFDLSFEIVNIELDNLSELEKVDMKKNVIMTLREKLNILDTTIININLVEGSIKVDIQIENITKEKSNELNSKKSTIPKIVEDSLKADNNLKNIPNISKPDVDNVVSDIKIIDKEIKSIDKTDDNINTLKSVFNIKFILLLVISLVIIVIMILFIIKK